MSNSSKIAELIADVREQVVFMQELGVEGLDAKISLTGAEVVPAAPAVDAEAFVPPPRFDRPATNTTAETPPRRAGSRIASLPSLANREKPAAAAIDPERGSTKADPDVTPKRSADVMPADEVRADAAAAKTADTIGSIRAEIGDCTRCKLHSLGRKQIVHSTGNFQADLMFVGEAPGADEDEQGLPFVGRAGQLLTKIIESIGLRRENVCIGNINRCRPPGNRQPEPDETAACRPFILREIAVVRPKVIVVLGATAAHNLLEVKTPISKLRGHFHDYFGVKVMPTFHPAYLLRDPHKKREVWEDMKKVRDMLRSEL